MSRPSNFGQRDVNSNPTSAAQRNLTLTEELEKLEQSITLTLQEIDHNFSRAHRIVTTSILPVVEQYAEHSKNVWEGSKFWKQFFEASANVSLSGYEEPPADDEATTTEEDDPTTTTPSTSTYNSSQPNTPSNHPYPNEEALSSSPTHSTPRPARQKRPVATAPYSSPYEALKRETFAVSPSESTLPSTPRTVASPVQQSSPFAPPSTSHHTAHRTPANDVLLHRILDKNWRIQATPHSTIRLPQRSKSFSDATPKPNIAKKGGGKAKENYDPDSSPAVPAPQLHSEIFGTPARKDRIPGVSVLTPARGKKVSAAEGGLRGKQQQIWDSDSDDDGEGDMGVGMSPPKTMQFHVPQPRLLRTPAREASKRIVEDLLLTAGGNVTDDLEEDSPSVVQRARLGDEDTF
ncbi:MAG: DASH complex subunit ask1 [Alectoria fallacina]|uniref:DASH complex subunit ASK1 n=1 Tax=Alectoria fallacina TaxID=1903189 RepID=A0A8H3J821_9LECA|nr:MAG: DASH complex subunit ask1 [Alectoria fallacina]